MRSRIHPVAPRDFAPRFSRRSSDASIMHMRAVVHFCRFILSLDQPRSQLTAAELDVLLKYARGAKIAVEIGCAEGKTSVALAQAVAGRIYSIDIFSRGRFGISYSEWTAKIHRRRRGVKNLEFVKGDSKAVAYQFPDLIDFLFIDADHSYDAVRADWNLWGSKVRPGGIIACHDCRIGPNNRNCLDSMRFYEEHMRHAPWATEIDGVDSLAVFRVLSTGAHDPLQMQ